MPVPRGRLAESGLPIPVSSSLPKVVAGAKTDLGFKPQTAIRGVFSVAIINILARVIGFGTHIVVTSHIGLSAQLDAYYVALTVLSIGILTFGDVFDSLGIPRLVRTLQEEGEDAFRSLSGSILSCAILLSIGLCLLLFAIAPWTTWIAPGFTPERRAFVLKSLYFMAPAAILYLPYHAIGSFLRARRRFRDFYIGDLFIASTSLIVVYIGRDHPFIVPISFSAAFVAGFVYVAAAGLSEVRLNVDLRNEKVRRIVRTFPSLLPLYLTGYLFPLVDRAFASYLPTGGISALSYGLLIALIPKSILMMENIFVTPLSESGDKETLMNNILCGVLIISVPIACFSAAFANQLVQAGLQRGVFTAESTKMTAEALAFFAPAIPAFFFWPICYRLLQVLEKLKAIAVISVAAVLLNGALNLLFMELGMGIKGLALATTIANYGLVGGAAILLRRNGISLLPANVRRVLFISAGVSAAALAVTFAVPFGPNAAFSTIVHGLIFVVATAALFRFVPNEDIRHWRETVFSDIFS